MQNLQPILTQINLVEKKYKKINRMDMVYEEIRPLLDVKTKMLKRKDKLWMNYHKKDGNGWIQTNQRIEKRAKNNFPYKIAS